MLHVLAATTATAGLEPCRYRVERLPVQDRRPVGGAVDLAPVDAQAGVAGVRDAAFHPVR
jgi:hypothetical protein